MPLVCYHGTNPYNISQDRVNLILEVLADPDKRKIISCIKNESKTVSQISKETGLPISNVYRKIGGLEENKLLISSAMVSSEKSRKEFTYKSKVRKVVVTFDDVLDVKVYSNLRNLS